MKLIAFIFAGMLSSTCFADQTSLTAFLSAAQGHWTGTGEVTMHIGKAGTYNIKITSDMTESQTDTWSLNSEIAGMPGSVLTEVTQYTVNGDQLVMTTSQYAMTTQIVTSTATELSLRAVHTDSITRHTVTIARDMTLENATTLHVTDDVYQDSSLVEHFDYLLNR